MDHSPALKNLKSLMQEAADFSLVWDHFFDLIGTTDFIWASEPSQLDRLASALDVIGNTGREGPRLVFRNLVVVRYRSSDFYHGTVDCPGHIGAFMYFESIDMGMLALTDVRTLESQFFRFALVIVDPGCSVVIPERQAKGPTEH